MMAFIFVQIIWGIFLIYISFSDIKRKSLYLWEMLAGFLPAVLLIVTGDNFSFLDSLLGVATGIFMVVISVITRGQIGIADGILIGEIGLGLGFGSCAKILCIALVLVAFFAAVMLATKGLNRKSKVPFVPFIMGGYGVVFLYNLSEMV